MSKLQTLHPGWVLLAIVVLGTGLRFYGLGAQPLWYDEAVTWSRAVMPLDEALAVTRSNDAHPPLYYLITRIALWFGDSEWMLRCLPALFGTMLIPIAYAVGYRVSGERAARYGALLVACSPLLVEYSREARVYSLLALAAGIAIWGLLGVTEAGIAQLPARRASWLAYWGGTTLSLYAFNTSIFFWIAAYLVVGAAMAYAGPGWPARLRRWSFAQLPILLVWSLRVPEMYTQIHSTGAPGWLDASWATLFEVTHDLWLGGVWGVRPWLTPLLVMLLVLAFWSWRRRPYWSVVLPGLVILALAIEFAVSQATPIMVSRALIWLALPLLVVVAVGISAIRPTWLGLVVLGLLLALNARGLQVYFMEFQKERWDLVARTIIEQRRPDDHILVHVGYLSKALRYQLNRLAPDLRLETLAGGAAPNADDLARIRHWLDEGQRFWLVQGRVHPAGVDGPLVRRLDEEGELRDHKQFRGSGFKLDCATQCIELFLIGPKP